MTQESFSEPLSKNHKGCASWGEYGRKSHRTLKTVLVSISLFTLHSLNTQQSQGGTCAYKHTKTKGTALTAGCDEHGETGEPSAPRGRAGLQGREVSAGEFPS